MAYLIIAILVFFTISKGFAFENRTNLDNSSAANITVKSIEGKCILKWTDVNCTSNECMECVQTAYATYSVLYPEQKIVIIGGYSIIMVIAIFLNLLIIATILRSQVLRTTQTCLVANLACSDILLIIFCAPFTLIGLLDGSKWHYGYILCKVTNIIWKPLVNLVLEAVSECKPVNLYAGTWKLFAKL